VPPLAGSKQNGLFHRSMATIYAFEHVFNVEKYLAFRTHGVRFQKVSKVVEMGDQKFIILRFSVLRRHVEPSVLAAFGVNPHQSVLEPSPLLGLFYCVFLPLKKAWAPVGH
jgi:hypothetical protein